MHDQNFSCSRGGGGVGPNILHRVAERHSFTVVWWSDPESREEGSPIWPARCLPRAQVTPLGSQSGCSKELLTTGVPAAEAALTAGPVPTNQSGGCCSVIKPQGPRPGRPSQARSGHRRPRVSFWNKGAHAQAQGLRLMIGTVIQDVTGSHHAASLCSGICSQPFGSQICNFSNTW